MNRIITERLILRRFKLSDLNDFFEYAKNPNVGPNAGWEFHKTREESLNLLNNFIKSDEVWAIELKEKSKVIGSIGLHKDRKRENKSACMIGYVLGEDFWGKGYATEAAKAIIKYAFERMNASILSVYHYSFNQRSKSVIIKCGFKFEGVLRYSTVTQHGEIYDDCCYSMTREEYMNSYKGTMST